MNNKRSFPWLNQLLFVALIGVSAFAGYLFVQNRDLRDQVPLTQEEEVQQLIDEISEFLDLPAGEEPSLATIEDVEQLRSQSFFENAQNGDKLLIYEEARRAFLYRESTNRIVNSGPISVSEQTDALNQSQPAPEPEEQEQASSADVSVLFYGSPADIDEARGRIGDNSSFNPSFEEASLPDDVDGPQPQILTINGSAASYASFVSGELGIDAVSSDLPEGVSAQESDIVIIL